MDGGEGGAGEGVGGEGAGHKRSVREQAEEVGEEVGGRSKAGGQCWGDRDGEGVGEEDG